MCSTQAGCLGLQSQCRFSAKRRSRLAATGRGARVGATAQGLLDPAGRVGGGMAAGATVHVAVDAFGGTRVELAVDPGVDDAAGPEVLDWVHVPETR